MECQVRDLSLYYEEYGTGIPVLMLHGMPTDHRHMVADMEPVFERRSGWRRIYPDLPGMGRTRAADWLETQDQMLDVTLEFIDALAPGERFAVIGVSYGGYLGQGIAYRRAAQMIGLALIVPSVRGVEEPVPPPQVIHEDPAFLAALTEEEQDLRRMFVVQSLAGLEHIRTFVSPAFAAADNSFVDRLSEKFTFSFDVLSLPEPCPCPALILTGRQDSLLGYRGAWHLVENYPRATFAVLDRAGHLLGIEQPDLFRALIADWLDRSEEYAQTP